MPVKNFQAIWERNAMKDQAKLDARTERETKLREKEMELGVRSAPERTSIHTDELEGLPSYDNEKLAELDEQIKALEVRVQEQKEHIERVAAEAKETAEIKKEKLEAEIAEKKEAIKEGIAGQLPTPPAKPPVVGKPEGPGPGTGTGKK